MKMAAGRAGPLPRIAVSGNCAAGTCAESGGVWDRRIYARRGHARGKRGKTGTGGTVHGKRRRFGTGGLSGALGRKRLHAESGGIRTGEIKASQPFWGPGNG